MSNVFFIIIVKCSSVVSNITDLYLGWVIDLLAKQGLKLLFFLKQQILLPVSTNLQTLINL